MKKYISYLMFISAIAMAMPLTSCMHNDNDDDEYSFSGDAAITTFYLAGAKQLMHTTSSTGEDSTYYESLTTTDYKFNIDNINGKIYNNDSLPYGTDAAHILVNVTAKSSGYVYLKSLTADEYYYVGGDSIDFSQPRTMRVVSQDGSSWRDYEVKVNIHQQDGDIMQWHHSEANSDIASLGGMKLIEAGGEMYLFGSNGTATIVMKANGDATQWEKQEITLGSDAWQNTVERDGNIYTLSGTTLLMLSNGTWNTVSDNAPIARLVAAGSKLLFGYDADNKLVASADGTTWTAETMDDDGAPLPTQSISYVAQTLKTTANIERITIIGKAEGEEYIQAWSRLADNTDASTPYVWTYIDTAGDYRYAATALDGFTAIAYDNTIIATALKNGKLQPFKQSRDNAITWKATDSLPLPDDIDTNMETFAMAADSNNFIWIVSGNTGEVWRGRLNRLSWQ